MKEMYLMLAAVFITLVISPVAYSAESSNLSMRYPMKPDVMPYVIYEANSSDENSSDEKPVVWDLTGAEVTIVEPSDEELKALEAKEPKYPYTLAFSSGSFTPTERLDPKIQNELASAGEGDYTYGFVMISGITTDTKLDTLTEHGVKLLEYHQHHCYKAKIPLNRIKEIGNLSFVRWIGYAPSDLKIHPTLKKKISSGNNDEIRIYISVFDSDLNENSEKVVHNDGKQYYLYISNGPFQNKLEGMGVTILAYDDRDTSFTARVTPDTINKIVDMDFVQFIEPGYPIEEPAGSCLTEGKMLGSMSSPRTDEPLEREEMTTGGSNLGIATIVLIAFAYMQRRLM